MADYGTDVALGLIPFLGPLSKAKKAGKTLKVAKTASRLASAKAKEKVEVKLREPPPAEGPRVPGEGGDLRLRDAPNARHPQHMERKARDLRREAEQGIARKTTQPRDTRGRTAREEFRREVERGIDRFHSDPEARELLRGELRLRDIDHRLDRQLGGSDIRSNFRTLDRSVNRSAGRQVQHQMRDWPEGTRVHNMERP
jgi:hypothetical protein